MSEQRPNPAVSAAAFQVPLVLASASPRRANILAAAGIAAELVPAHVDEDLVEAPAPPADRALSAARAKASSVARRRPDAVTLGADTIVVLDGEVLGKPAGRDEAVDTLRRLRGRGHRVITAVALEGALGSHAGYSVTDVWFRDFSDAEVARYVSSGAPLDKAGSYGIQDRPFSPGEHVRGCYLNVVGLPLCLVAALLAAAGTGPAVTCQGCEQPVNFVADAHGRPA